MLVTSISPFLTVFSKGLFFRVVKSCDCVVKGSDTSPSFNDPYNAGL